MLIDNVWGSRQWGMNTKGTIQLILHKNKVAAQYSSVLSGILLVCSSQILLSIGTAGIVFTPQSSSVDSLIQFIFLKSCHFVSECLEAACSLPQQTLVMSAGTKANKVKRRYTQNHLNFIPLRLTCIFTHPKFLCLKKKKKKKICFKWSVQLKNRQEFLLKHTEE